MPGSLEDADGEHANAADEPGVTEPLRHLARAQRASDEPMRTFDAQAAVGPASGGAAVWIVTACSAMYAEPPIITVVA